MRKLWRRWATAAVATAGLTAGLLATATPAGAATQATSQVTQSQQRVVTASCTTARNYKGNWFTVTYCNGQYHRYACNIGDSGDLFGPLYAANGCQTQVVMRSSDGFSLCVNPEASTNSLHMDYISYSIRKDTGPC